MKIGMKDVMEFFGMLVAGAIVIVIAALVIIPCFLLRPIGMIIEFSHRNSLLKK